MPEHDLPPQEMVAKSALDYYTGKLAAREKRMREVADEIMAHCERYWNEHNIPEAEVHSVLAIIRGWAAKLLEGQEAT